MVLVAEGTRDEGAKEAAKRKEEFMKKAVRRVSRGLSGNPHKDLSNLISFGVQSSDVDISAADFVLEARGRHRKELAESDSTPIRGSNEPTRDPLPPENFRPSGQTGLDQF